MNQDDKDHNVGILNYILENCLFAHDELCRINKDLVQGMSPHSNANVTHLGAMNRILQDYLIIRVGGLFDRTEYRVKNGTEDGADDEVVSLEKLLLGDKDFEDVKGREIIKYIINQRHNFVAHVNKKHIESSWPITEKICNSNLKELLENLQKLLKKRRAGE